MKKFRGIIFWIHLVCGAVGGTVIFIMCVTGAALSFEKIIIEQVESDQRTVRPGPRRMPVSMMLASVVAARPESKPSSLSVKNEPGAAVAVSLGREGQIFVDPYTGQITGEGNKSVRGFFGTMTDLHRWLMMSGDGRPVGKAITGACNLMFLLLAITGIYIWMPRRLEWRRMRPNLWFRRKVTGRARDFNWHNTIGLWSSLVLVVLTVTAAVISYQWAGNLVYTLTGNPLPQPQANNAAAEQAFSIPPNIDEIWARAEAQSEWKTISLRLPIAKEAVFTIDEGKSRNIFGRSTLTVDSETAAVTKWDPYETRNSAQQIRSWMRYTHTGESFGLFGQFIGFVACVGGAFLVYTGFSLAIRRLSRWLGSRKTKKPLQTS